MAKNPFGYIAIFLFVLDISEIQAATSASKLCEKSSMTYSGLCFNFACDKKCIEWEKAFHGACHTRESVTNCYCYYECSKAPPSTKPVPPEAMAPSPDASSGGGAGGGAGGGEGGGGGADGGSPPANNPCKKIAE